MVRSWVSVAVVVVACSLILFSSSVSALTPPTLVSAAAAPGFVAPGDFVHVDAEVSDYSATHVYANGFALKPDYSQPGYVWHGDVPVSPSLGTHSIDVVVYDRSGTSSATYANVAQYQTTSVFGVSGRMALTGMVRGASTSYLFKVWGKAQVTGADAFTVSDGSAYPVKVIAAGHGVADGDYVWARGYLDFTDAPPATLKNARYGILQMQPRPTITASEVSVGKDLQTFCDLDLPSPVPAGTILSLNVLSCDSSRALVSASSTSAGVPRITLSVPAGGIKATFYVSGFADSGTTDVLVSGAGGLYKVVKVNLCPSGFYFPAGDLVTGTYSPNSLITLGTARLDPVTKGVVQWQKLRAGMPNQSVPVTSSNTSVGVMAKSPLTFVSSQNYPQAEFDPVAEGTTVLSIGAPAGFTVPSDKGSVIATVEPIAIGAMDVSVGKNAQTAYSFSLKVAPPSPQDVTVTVGSTDVATLSTSATVNGTGSVTFTGVSSIFVPEVWVQGRGLGNTTLTISSPGYETTVKTITVTPAGFAIKSNDINTTSLSSNSDVQIGLARLDLETMKVAEYQYALPGVSSPSVAVTSSDPGVGVITQSPLAFGPGISSVTTKFDPIAPGTSTIAISTPDGFSTPSEKQSILATVSLPPIAGTDMTVGKELEKYFYFNLALTPSAPVDVTVTSGSESIATVSSAFNTVGTASSTLTGISSTANFPVYVHGRGIGTTTLTVSAPGYTPCTKKITVVPSGFAIYSLAGKTTFDGLNTTTVSTPTAVAVATCLLDPVTLAPSSYAQLRAGIGKVDVQVVSSDPVVGSISTSPLSFTTSESPQTTSFTPLAVGTTTITVVTPPGFTTPSLRASVTANVDLPEIFAQDAVTGKDLQLRPAVYPLVAPRSPVDVTVSVGSPDIAVVSKSATVAGSGSITISGVSVVDYLPVYIQGKSVGTTTYTVSAPGYWPVTKQITVDPAGFVFSGSSGFTTYVTSANSQVSVRPVPLDPVTLPPVGNFCFLCPGVVPVSVSVTSSNPSIGTILSGTLSFGTSNGALSTYFDPISAGSAVVSVSVPPGFSTPDSAWRQLTITVLP